MFAARVVQALLIASLLGGVIVAASPVLLEPQPAQTQLDEFLARVEAAQVELVRGRPEAFKALWSQRDDVTLTGGLGGAIEKGWAAVSRRLDWVSSQYADGRRSHQEVSRVVGRDLAYVVQKETIQFRAPGGTDQVTQELRAVMVFRLEAGEWRIAHRQADAQTVRQPPR